MEGVALVEHADRRGADVSGAPYSLDRHIMNLQNATESLYSRTHGFESGLSPYFESHTAVQAVLPAQSKLIHINSVMEGVERREEAERKNSWHATCSAQGTYSCSRQRVQIA